MTWLPVRRTAGAPSTAAAAPPGEAASDAQPSAAAALVWPHPTADSAAPTGPHHVLPMRRRGDPSLDPEPAPGLSSFSFPRQRSLQGFPGDVDADAFAGGGPIPAARPVATGGMHGGVAGLAGQQQLVAAKTQAAMVVPLVDRAGAGGKAGKVVRFERLTPPPPGDRAAAAAGGGEGGAWGDGAASPQWDEAEGGGEGGAGGPVTYIQLPSPVRVNIRMQ